MSAREKQLLEAAYADAHLAAYLVSTITTGNRPFNLENIRHTRRILNSASAPLVTLESIVAANPQPKQGD
jgi:hypothetical protein